MKHLKSFNESFNDDERTNTTVYFRLNGKGYHYKLKDEIPNFQENFARLHGDVMRTNFFIAAMIENKFNFSFKDKEIKGQYLYCSFKTSDQFKLSISNQMSNDNFDIVLCTLQEDGRYLRVRSIGLDTVEQLLKKIDVWRTSDKLSAFNKITGALE